MQQQWLQVPEDWERVQEVDTASFEDAVNVLAYSVGVSPERLLWFRTRIWWELNDRYRIRNDGTPISNAPHWPEADERANMKAMLEHLECERHDSG